MTFVRLYEHPFFREVSEAVAPQIEQSIATMRDLFGPDDTPTRQRAPDDEGPYAWRVFRRQASLVLRLQHADDSRRHLGWTPTGRQLASANTDESSWVEYHFANFVVLLADVPDLALLLINETYRLGVPPREAKRAVICRNRWVRGSPVVRAFDTLADEVRTLREARNLHLHRGETPRPDTVLGSNDFLSITVGTVLARVSKNPKLEQQSRKLMRAQGRRLAELLTTEIESVATACHGLFDALEDVFHDRAKNEWREPA